MRSATVEVTKGIRWEVMSHGVSDSRPCILVPVSDARFLAPERLAEFVAKAMYSAELVRAVFDASYVLDRAKGFKPSQIAKQFPGKTLTDLKRFAGQHEEIDRAIEVLEDALVGVAKKKAVRIEVASNYGDLFVAIGRRDGFMCAHCGGSGDDLEIDHIYPVSKGGDNAPDNLQLLCKDCNIAKGARV